MDESGALYHVGEQKDYLKMLFLVSDHDMENRYEQTMLMISTLKHFGHGEEKVRLKVLHGGHCQYYKPREEYGGESPFGVMAAEFIESI